MELELPEGSSDENSVKLTEKDGFSEYVQATANAPVFEPEIEESDDGNGSPSPIVIKEQKRL